MVGSKDEELRALAREVEAGDAAAAERYIVANRQAVPFEEAVDAFLLRLNAAIRAHYERAFKALVENDTYPRVERDRSSARSPKFLRLVAVESGVSYRSVYCFVDRAAGTILKPGGFKAPEPKRIPRGSIYALDCLRGCGPHGVAYVKSSGHYGGAWAPGVLEAAAVRVEIGPSLPLARKEA